MQICTYFSSFLRPKCARYDTHANFPGLLGWLFQFAVLFVWHLGLKKAAAVSSRVYCSVRTPCHVTRCTLFSTDSMPRYKVHVVQYGLHATLQGARCSVRTPCHVTRCTLFSTDSLPRYKVHVVQYGLHATLQGARCSVWTPCHVTRCTLFSRDSMPRYKVHVVQYGLHATLQGARCSVRTPCHVTRCTLFSTDSMVHVVQYGLHATLQGARCSVRTPCHVTRCTLFSTDSMPRYKVHTALIIILSSIVKHSKLINGVKLLKTKINTHTHTKSKSKKQSVLLPLIGHAIWHSQNARALSGPMSQCNTISWSRARNSQVD